MAQKAEIRSTLPSKIEKCLSNFWSMALVYSLLLILLRAVEFTLIFQNHVLPLTYSDLILLSLLDDFSWLLYFLGLLFIIHSIISFFSIRLAAWFTNLIFVIAILAHIGFIFYFSKTLVPLGSDLFAYSIQDLILTVQASGQFNLISTVGAILLLLFLGFLFAMARRKIEFALKTTVIISISAYWFLLIYSLFPIAATGQANETKQNIEFNKSKFLSFQAFDYLMFENEYYFDFYLRSSNEEMIVKKEFFDTNYPFLHRADYPDVLSPYFDSLTIAPDIVFILVESLGKAYSGSGAYLGSFTPFLDSLEQHSLVWNNAISSTGRTFGILPGVFSGLPFGKNGFLEMNENIPHHNSLLRVLGANGYESHYFIGADLDFDNQGDFLRYQGVDQLVGVNDFDPKYQKIPASSGFSWGYFDKELFQNALEKLPADPQKPQLRIFQTQTSHDPYLVPDPEEYSLKLRSYLAEDLKLNSAELANYLTYEGIYATLLYTDEAISEFFAEYSKRPEFANTIFIITGDHRLPEIPMASRLDRFHVPLMIYSPLIKRPTMFKGVTSHFEVTPTLLSFLINSAGITIPETAVWMGQVMDTSQVFQSRISMPLMRNKNQLVDYISGEYFLSQDQLFLISDGLAIDPVQDPDMLNKLTGEFEDYKNKNNYIIQTRNLLPKEE